MSTLIVNEIRSLDNIGNVTNLSVDASGNAVVGGDLYVGGSSQPYTYISSSQANITTVNCTTLNSTEAVNAPFTVASSVKVTNLNADSVNGKTHGSAAGDMPLLGADGTANTISVSLLGKATPSGDLVGTSDTQAFTNKSFNDDVTVNGNLTVQSASGNSTITCDGDIIAFNTSDIRLKKNIKILSDTPLEDVNHLRGVRFQWIPGEDSGRTEDSWDVGIIAQEVRECLPEAVVERKNGTLGVRYELIIPLLIEAVNELSDKVSNQTLEIDNLKKIIAK